MHLDFTSLLRIRFIKRSKKLLVFLCVFFALVGGLSAQVDFPAGDFWALDVGTGMSGMLVDGTSFQILIDPRLWLSPPLMVGSKVGINYSNEKPDANLGNILTFEGQVYVRWNFWNFGNDPNRQASVFVQGGLGLISAYRGTTNPFNNVTETRGSVLAEGALGITIPLTNRWHIEPQIRGGYPHLYGLSVTAGYKFPLPEKTKYQDRVTERVTPGATEYVEIMRMLPAQEIVRRLTILAVEFVMFGPDIGRYNIGIDNDARQLNELIVNYTADLLKKNPSYLVRIEGHANPVTNDVNEADELMVVSTMRANAIAEQLRERGVNEEQMVIIAFGGVRTVAPNSENIRNRNRRVELQIIHVRTD